MRNHDGGTIPWGASEVGPGELVTAKDRTPEQQEQAHEEALIWAIENGQHNKSYREYLRRRIEAAKENELVAK